jgi:hypothetical protein
MIKSDTYLLKKIKEIRNQEKNYTSQILDLLIEIERRRLFADLGHSSIFHYCIDELGYSKNEAYCRINAMRLIRKIPEVKKEISNGSISLTSASFINDFFRKERKYGTEKLTPKREKEIIDKVRNHSTRGTQRILREVASFKQEKKLKILLKEETILKLEKLQDLMNGFSLEEVVEILASEKLNDIMQPKRNIQSNPYKRHIPQSLKSQIRQRAGSQCEFISKDGVRCCERKNLEFDHIKPFALGGLTVLENLRLYCRTHNQRAAIKTYGQKKMEKFINSS